LAEQAVAAGLDAEGGIFVHRELALFPALAILEIGHLEIP
jgi:hypothetical protein